MAAEGGGGCSGARPAFPLPLRRRLPLPLVWPPVPSPGADGGEPARSHLRTPSGMVPGGPTSGVSPSGPARGAHGRRRAHGVRARAPGHCRDLPDRAGPGPAVAAGRGPLLHPWPRSRSGARAAGRDWAIRSRSGRGRAPQPPARGRGVGAPARGRAPRGRGLGGAAAAPRSVPRRAARRRGLGGAALRRRRSALPDRLRGVRDARSSRPWLPARRWSARRWAHSPRCSATVPAGQPRSPQPIWPRRSIACSPTRQAPSAYARKAFGTHGGRRAGRRRRACTSRPIIARP